MATTPPMIGGADPTVLKSLETQTPSVAKTAPPTVSATTGTITSSGSQVARGIAPRVTNNTTTYNQATQTASGTSLTITSSTSNDPADIVTVYNSPKAISVSSVNQTVNTYKVTNVTGDAGVSQIIAGNNITITSTGANGTGNVTINSSAANVGNIAILNLDGNASNVLHGDGTWSADQTTYGNSNVASYLPTYTGNVGANVVTANLFSGNGSSLTAIAGANVTGTVEDANLSQYLAVSDVNNNFSYHVVLSAGSGDKSLHIDADDNLQYNPADGTLTAVRVDATYVLANLNFSDGYLASNLVGSASNIANGNSNVNIATANGNVAINSSDKNWTFGTDGNLTVPGNILSTQSSNLIIGSSYSVKIVGDNGDNNLTWTFDGSSGEIQLPFGAIIDPSDDNFEVRAVENVNFEANAVVNIYTDTSNNGFNWQFGDNGVLQVPGAIATLSGSSNLVLNPQQGTATDSFIQVPTFQDGGEELIIKNGFGGTAQGVRIQTGGGNLIFDASGNLVLPGNLSYTGASPAPSISGFSSVNTVFSITTPVSYATLTATAGARAFINDANIVASGNFGAQVGNGGSNIVPVYSDGTNWYIG